MSVLHNPASSILPEALVAYRIVDGVSELVIASAFSNSRMWLLGYIGETYMIAQNYVRFSDVDASGWYYRAIKFAAARELFAGMGDGRFEPSASMTRAMFITVLSRLDDADIAAGGSWYSGAISWALAEGIIPSNMLNGNDFNSHQNITREEMAAIIAGYLGQRDFPIRAAAAPAFYDIGEADLWARSAINAMRRYQIIAGMGDNTFNPKGEATRAEVSQIFSNLVRAILGGF